MDRMDYEALKTLLDTGGPFTLDFMEYVPGDLGKRLTLEFTGAEVLRYVRENEFLDPKELEAFLELEGNIGRYTYCPYYYPYLRLVIRLEQDVYLIHVNKLAVDIGMQVVNLHAATTRTGAIKQWQ